MNKNTEELKAKLNSLEAELVEVEGFLAKVPEMEKRRSELRDGWDSYGEIKMARYELRDSAFPILNETGWSHTRIIEVDDKWITTRDDNRDDVKRYHRDTGRQERKRSDWNNIDVKEALEIWEAHKKNGEK